MGSVPRPAGGHPGAAPWRYVARQGLRACGTALAGVTLVMTLAAAGGIGDPGGGSGVTSAAVPRSALRRIVLPDLLVVLPSGLTKTQCAGLREIKGVRKMITFDGARITAAGRPASVIGVSPGQFRSWVPLGAATDQHLWAELAAGDFIESSQATGLPHLSAGRGYRLTGTASVRVGFAARARIAIAGVDLLVNRAVSRALGLVPRVAALISAPGPSMARLTARVRMVLGPGAKVVDLRARRLPAVPVRPGRITSYLQLFRASAATYCPQISWTILAAIGQIESGDGQNVGPSSAGALGPMQFLPSTWAEWGIDGFGPAGPPDIMNPLDAVPSAARMLCADGASSGTPAGLRQAIFAYNHADWYVEQVLALAAQYASGYH